MKYFFLSLLLLCDCASPPLVWNVTYNRNSGFKPGAGITLQPANENVSKLLGEWLESEFMKRGFSVKSIYSAAQAVRVTAQDTNVIGDKSSRLAEKSSSAAELGVSQKFQSDFAAVFYNNSLEIRNVSTGEIAVKCFLEEYHSYVKREDAAALVGKIWREVTAR